MKRLILTALVALIPSTLVAQTSAGLFLCYMPTPDAKCSWVRVALDPSLAIVQNTDPSGKVTYVFKATASATRTTSSSDTPPQLTVSKTSDGKGIEVGTCTFTQFCNALIGSVVKQYQSAKIESITSTPNQPCTIRLYLDKESKNVIAGGEGCVTDMAVTRLVKAATTITAYPPRSIPLGECLVVNSSVQSCNSFTPYAVMTDYIVPGQGLSSMDNASTGATILIAK